MTIPSTPQKIKQNYKTLNFVKQTKHGLLIRMSVDTNGKFIKKLLILAGLIKILMITAA